MFLLSLTSLFGQDHAPTVEQCRADERLWSTQLIENPGIIKSLRHDQLNDRMLEMANCAAVDRDRESVYAETAARFNMKLMVRLFDFIKRHKLLDQFMAEDAAGQR
jgi:hypothetical protein